MTIKEARRILLGMPKDIEIVSSYNPFPGQYQIDVRSCEYGVNLHEIVEAAIVLALREQRALKAKHGQN